MKKINAFLVSVLATAALNAAVIEQVIVRQQWPWSTDIKVEYKLSGVTTPVNIGIKAYNGDAELPLPDEAIIGERYGVAKDGICQFTIDPVAAFGTEQIALANFKVKLTVSDASADSQDVLYKIIDLTTSPFKTTDVRRCDFYNGKYGAFETDFSKIGEGYKTTLNDVFIWTGVTNYPGAKTTKLVMRKISAKDVEFDAGYIPGNYLDVSPNSGSPKVTLRRDFWIGVFEVTERQYELLTAVNGNPGRQPDHGVGDDYAMRHLYYENLRGKPASWTDFPANRYAVTADSDIQRMRNNLPGATFDLPGEYEWEYACRAGTTNDIYVGFRTQGMANIKPALAEIAWDGDVTNTVMQVGLLRPNAFGLYDIIGNVAEKCRDLTTILEKTDPVPPATATLDDPIGMTDTTCGYSISRGGSYYRGYTYTCSGIRRFCSRISADRPDYEGLRLYMPAE